MISEETALGILNEGAVSIDYSFKSFIQKAKECEPMKQIFGDYFHTGELCFLGGKQGVGKSTLAYTIADGIARGESILGQPNEAGAQKVLYYDFELSEGNIQKRFNDYEPPETFLRPDMKEIMERNDYQFNFDLIGDDIDETGAKVVIIDNISAIALKCTQDQQQALDLMKAATVLKQQKDISLLILMHTTKQKEPKALQAGDLAGSSTLMNFADSCIIVDKSARSVSERYIKQGKSRNAMELDKVLTVEVVNNGWLHHEFTGFENETDLLPVEEKGGSNSRAKLLEVAETVLGNDSLSYNDFCEQYAKIFNKSIESGRTKFKALRRENIIFKDDTSNKWSVNGNEVAGF